MSTLIDIAKSPISIADVSVRFAKGPDEFAAIVELRRRVFRDEQNIVESDVIDSEDRNSYQAMAVISDGLIGTGRLTPATAIRPHPHIAWVATLPDYRGIGIGSYVMRSLLEVAEERRMRSVTLSAQTHALEFYVRLGFEPYGDRFLVRGIEHQMMVWRRRA
jgi:predicted GNAT family N-acyltransferase